MAEEESGLTIKQIDRSLIPEGVSIGKAPETPQQAISFELEPETSTPSLEAAPTAASQEISLELEPIEEEQAQVAEPVSFVGVAAEDGVTPLVSEKPLAATRAPSRAKMATKEEIVKVPVYKLLPEGVGAGTYLGMVWAVSEKEAQTEILAQFGGKIEWYTYDLFNKGPRPYWVLIKPLEEIKAIEGQEEPAPVPEIVPVMAPEGFWIAKCPFDLSETNVPNEIDTFTCPIDGSVIKKPVQVFFMAVDYIAIIQGVGFPIAVSVWFMFRMEKVIQKNTEVLIIVSEELKKK